MRLCILVAVFSLLPWPSNPADARVQLHLLTANERQEGGTIARLAGRNVKKAQSWASHQRDVSTTTIGPDGATLEIWFRDGARLAVVPNTFGAIRTRVRSLEMRGHAAVQAGAASGRALVLEPFAKQLDQGNAVGKIEVDALVSAGLKVDVVRDAAVSIAVIEKMSDYSVVYMETHSGLLPGGDALVLTGETDAGPYTALFRDGSVVQGMAAGDPNHLYVAYTKELISKHVGRFPDSSIVFVNGCSILAASAFLQALFQQNASAVISWDEEAYNAYAEDAADFIFPRLASGKTVGATVADTQSVGLATSPSPNGIAHLGFRGDPNATFPKALVGATATPTSSATPVAATATPAPATATATFQPTVSPTPAPTATATATTTVVAARLKVVTKGKLKANRDVTLRVIVRGSTSASPVRGAIVSVDGRKVGLSRVLKMRTNTSGIASFAHLRAKRSGALLLTVSKQGFDSAKRTLKVQP